MDSRLQMRVQRYGWDAAASHYHDGWEDQLRPVHETLLAMMDAKQGDRVFEAACGSGIVTMRVAKTIGTTGRILATDISEGMLDVLRSRLDVGTYPNIELARMSAEHLEIPDGGFDCSICALGLMYSPEPELAIKELARVTRPGGTVVVSVWGERPNCGWAEVFPIVDARVTSDVCPLFFASGAKGALPRLFHLAGLEEVREHRQFATLHYPSADALLRAVLLGGPVALAVKRFSRTIWEEVCKEFLASVADFRTRSGGYRVPAEFVTVVGQVSVP